jgi:hypothetical protein
MAKTVMQIVGEAQPAIVGGAPSRAVEEARDGRRWGTRRRTAYASLVGARRP